MRTSTCELDEVKTVDGWLTLWALETDLYRIQHPFHILLLSQLPLFSVYTITTKTWRDKVRTTRASHAENIRLCVCLTCAVSASERTNGGCERAYRDELTAMDSSDDVATLSVCSFSCISQPSTP